MKPGQYFALIIGILYVLVGLAGFVPDFVQPPMGDPNMERVAFTQGYGDLLGLFPINLPHNIVHLTVGLLGVLASISLGSSRLFSGLLAIFYGALTILGLFPATQTMFGLVPIFGNDVWLHALTAAIAAYFGFFATPDLREMREQNVQNQTPSMR